MKEYIMRLIYIEMLGHNASFGYIHALKMTHDDSLLLKRTGYLAVTLFLHEDHDLIILIVNTIQKDLKSDNFLVVCAALNVACKLINEEAIPAVIQQVVELLGHPKEAVRKKAVMALHRFYQRSPSSVTHLVSNFRKKLCDNDPGVMGATLCPLFDLIMVDANTHKDLVGSFVSILKQVAERRLPKSYDYYRTPAPFIQIKLLKILSLLGSGDKKCSEQMYTIIGDIMRKSDTTSNIGNAVLYECICCLASIHHNPKLFGAAADAIAKFLKSDIHNLKYMGIDALGRLIRIRPEIAEQYQLALIDCLEDPDDTLKRKTFELLYKMTKSSNVEVIVDRMIEYMISIKDNHYKTEIASRCVELSEQFAPTNYWFIQTMNKVFQHAMDLVNPKVAHNLMRLIAEGFGGDDDTADSELRSSAVESYLALIGDPKLPSMFLQVICWVLGEYGTADGKCSAAYISGKLCDVAEAHPSDDTVLAYAVTALMKVFSFEKAAGRNINMDMLPECQSLIESLCASHSTDLQQRAYELQAIIKLDAIVIQNIMPLDASCEDTEIDKSLSFLSSYVQKSLEEGAQPYIPEHERSGKLNIRHHDATHSLRFEADDVPKPVIPRMPAKVVSSTELVHALDQYYQREIQRSPSVGSLTDTGPTELRLRLDGVQKKWGRPSYSSAATSSIMDIGSSGRQPQVEVSQEKQKLAASLFGATSSRSENKQSGGGGGVGQGQRTGKGSKATRHTADQTSQLVQPPPGLLDLGEPSFGPSGSSSIVDPFKQLEGLGSGQDGNVTTRLSKGPDSMSMYSETGISGQNHNAVGSNLGHGSGRAAPTMGPNREDALGKDALIRQMGVTPTSQNPNLFKDLLG